MKFNKAIDEMISNVTRDAARKQSEQSKQSKLQKQQQIQQQRILRQQNKQNKLNQPDQQSELEKQQGQEEIEDQVKKAAGDAVKKTIEKNAKKKQTTSLNTKKTN